VSGLRFAEKLEMKAGHGFGSDTGGVHHQFSSENGATVLTLVGLVDTCFAAGAAIRARRFRSLTHGIPSSPAGWSCAPAASLASIPWKYRPIRVGWNTLGGRRARSGTGRIRFLRKHVNRDVRSSRTRAPGPEPQEHERGEWQRRRHEPKPGITQGR